MFSCKKLIHKAFYIGSLERGKPHVQAGRNGLTGEIMESVGGEVIETETIVCIVDAISRILGRRDAKCLALSPTKMQRSPVSSV